MEVSDHAYGACEPAKSRALLDSSTQVGEFKVAVGIDKARAQYARVEFNVGYVVEPLPLLYAHDATFAVALHKWARYDLATRDEMVGSDAAHGYSALVVVRVSISAEARVSTLKLSIVSAKMRIIDCWLKSLCRASSLCSE